MDVFEITWSDGFVQTIEAVDRLEAKLLAEKQRNNPKAKGLSGTYIPAAKGCFVLDVKTPDTMEYEIHAALEQVKELVGGDLVEFVRQKLNYKSKESLCKALASEQIDGVALSIFNIEQRGQGVIIGDQTGIGKGRQAAAVIRYAIEQGKQPIFLTQAPNLFSDLFRDLKDISFDHVTPFLVNGRSSDTNIKNEDGKIIHRALPSTEQKKVIASQEVPGKYDLILSTYSQFANSKWESSPTAKNDFLRSVAKDNILILDEAHVASGSSGTGGFMQSVVSSARGVVFLSATFAKRPDNMPLYAMKTAMMDASISDDALVDAIQKGGVALQEVLASQLVAEGQMIRRERGFDGVQTNYNELIHQKETHRAIADNITAIMRDIVDFQEEYVSPVVKGLDKAAGSVAGNVEARKGTAKAGVSNSPYFNKLFNVINQMLFSVKAKEVAEKCIERAKEGKGVVVAFSSTMGSFVDDLPMNETVDVDFTEVLKKGLNSVLRITRVSAQGTKDYEMLSPMELGEEGFAAYNGILTKIKNVSSGISISPIDVMIEMIEAEGYKVAEVTGRSKYIQFNDDRTAGIVLNRPSLATTDAFRMFNDNEVDVLMINQKGSTGASAQAKPTDKVPAEKVRQRCMVILQAELDINKEIQKRGRIYRTGQIKKPIYDYVTSEIPAEKRLMMMLQSKLKSLDANTSASQKSSEEILKSDDFLNKYGDKVVAEWLAANPTINKMIGDPLKIEASTDSEMNITVDVHDAARKVSGRMAITPTKIQELFYRDVINEYKSYVRTLIDEDKYDLELEQVDLKAETIDSKVVVVGKSAASVFGDDTILEECRVNNLRKPLSRVEVENHIEAALEGKSKLEYDQLISKDFITHMQGVRSTIERKEAERLQKQLRHFNDDPLYKKIKKDSPNLSDYQVQTEFESQARSFSEEKLKMALLKINSIESSILKYLNFFKIGMAINYSRIDFSGGMTRDKGVFLGWDIDKRKSNPYAPSSIKAKFAIASSVRSKKLSLSGDNRTVLDAIVSDSYRLSNSEANVVLGQWDDIIQEASEGRVRRFIITGNLLQGFSYEENGRMISYTTLDGKIKKGVILPDNWSPLKSKGKSDNVVIPISKAFPMLKNLPNRGTLNVASERIFFSRDYNGLILFVPSSKRQGAKYFQNQTLMNLMENGGFEKVGSEMRGYFSESNAQAILDELQAMSSLAVNISKAQFEIYKDSIKESSKRTIQITPKQESAEVEKAQEDNSSKADEKRKLSLLVKVRLSLQKQRLRLKKAA